MIFNEQTISPLIKQAMREKAPEMFKELMASGTLEQAISERAKAAVDSYATAIDQAMNQALTSKGSHSQDVQQMTQARNLAVRVALDQAVEFGEPESQQAATAA